jgi:hypothetical protein
MQEDMPKGFSELVDRHFWELGETMTELAEIINAPVLTTGVFQGHKGSPVVADESKLDRIIRGSNELRPLIRAAQQIGEFPGNPGLVEKLGKAIPAYININHDSPETDRIRDVLRSVDVQFKKEFILDKETGEVKPWIVESFDGVDPLAAEFIRRYFPKRSIELLSMINPETGEFFEDGVIISTAFLDNATPPAVPGQSADLLVEFSAPENSAATVITTQQPLLMEENIMPDKKVEKVDVSELQTEKDTLAAELKARNEAIELARKDAEAKDAKLQELQAQISTLQEKDATRDIDTLSAELKGIFDVDGAHYQVSRAFLEIVTPKKNEAGLIELAEGETRESVAARLQFAKTIAELAAKNAIVVRLDQVGSKNYNRVDTPPASDTEAAKELAAKLKEENPKLSDEEASDKAFVAVLNKKYGRAE